MSTALPSFRTTAPRVTLVAAATCLALVSGCGNRVDHERVVAVGNGYGPVQAGQDRLTVPDPDAAEPDAGARKAGPTDRDGVAAGPLAPVARPERGASVSSSPGTVSGGRSGATGSTPGATRPQNAACPSSLSPIVLGQTLASSGLVGAAIAGLRTGLAVWAKDVNARGGVQCHPVQLIQLDDGSDSARVSANWNSMVHDRGAVAILGSGVPIANAALRTAAERDKVPVIGGDITTEDWNQSPFMFPTGGAPLTAYDGSVVDAAKAVGGAVKAGMIYCVEASVCTSIKNNFPRSVERAGVSLGPIAAVSLTQPDFSAECQRLKAAGVNLAWFAVDGSASVRAARSCASLNYFPTIATGSIAVSAAAAADAGLRRNTMYLGTPVAPYSTTDTPGVVAFHDAMRRYAASAIEEQQALLGWAAGKLFEVALSKVAARAQAGDVTTAMILDGLWQVKDEKLDGLSPGATFTRGKPAAYLDCYYGLKLDAGGFSAVRGSKPTCFGESKKLEHATSDASAPRRLVAPEVQHPAARPARTGT